MNEKPKSMHPHGLMRLCLLAALVAALWAAAAYAETGAEGLLAQTVTIEDVSRDSQDGWVRVRTDFGDRFTQAGVDFPRKNGAGTLRLDGSGRLESLLMARVGTRVVLLVSPDVDGLIVGIVLDDGRPALDKIIKEGP